MAGRLAKPIPCPNGMDGCDACEVGFGHFRLATDDEERAHLETIAAARPLTDEQRERLAELTTAEDK